MMYRKCPICNQSGSIWGTPKLVEDGGLLNSTVKKSLSDNAASDWNYGLSVTCWRCLGKGMVLSDRQDTHGPF